jgi:hypothetical protein
VIPEDGARDNISMSTKKAWLWAIFALIMYSAVDALVALVLPGWGPVVMGAIFAAVVMWFIRPRWTRGRK